MRLKVYFIFLPSDELKEAVTEVGEPALSEVSVWNTSETDRCGLEHSEVELKDSFWADFKAKLIYENESEVQRRFRERCLTLGFDGCWTVVKTNDGGSADELVDSGDEAKEFLKSFNM